MSTERLNPPRARFLTAFVVAAWAWAAEIWLFGGTTVETIDHLPAYVSGIAYGLLLAVVVVFWCGWRRS